MADPLLLEFEDLTGLTIEPVIHGPVRSAGLEALIEQYLTFFSEQPHVVEELESIWQGKWPDEHVVTYAWLFRLAGEPVGLSVHHTNLRRRIVTQHYLGLDSEAGKSLPLRWVKQLVDTMLATGIRDCAAAGTTLLGQIGENQEAHVRAWERFGYLTLDVDYMEPDHGRSWDKNDGPHFHPRIIQLRLTDEGRALPLGDVAERAIKAFLLDYYLVPVDDPSVQNSIRKAALLSPS